MTGLVRTEGREGIDNGGGLYRATRHVGLLLAHVLRSVHYVCLWISFFVFVKMAHDLSQLNFNRDPHTCKRSLIALSLMLYMLWKLISLFTSDNLKKKLSWDIFRRNRGLWVYALLYQCTLSIFSSYENFYQYNYLDLLFCLFHFTILALYNIEKVLSIWKINFVRVFGDSVELGAISFYVSIKIITVYISITMRFLSFIYDLHYHIYIFYV